MKSRQADKDMVDNYYYGSHVNIIAAIGNVYRLHPYETLLFLEVQKLYEFHVARVHAEAVVISLNSLAERTRLDKRTIRKTLIRLIDAKLVVKVKENKGHEAAAYSINNAMVWEALLKYGSWNSKCLVAADCEDNTATVSFKAKEV